MGLGSSTSSVLPARAAGGFPAVNRIHGFELRGVSKDITFRKRRSDLASTSACFSPVNPFSALSSQRSCQIRKLTCKKIPSFLRDCLPTTRRVAFRWMARQIWKSPPRLSIASAIRDVETAKRRSALIGHCRVHSHRATTQLQSTRPNSILSIPSARATDSRQEKLRYTRSCCVSQMANTPESADSRNVTKFPSNSCGFVGRIRCKYRGNPTSVPIQSIPSAPVAGRG